MIRIHRPDVDVDPSVVGFRRLYLAPHLEDCSDNIPEAVDVAERSVVTSYAEANLVSSEETDLPDLHHPVLDLDGPDPAAVAFAIADWYRRQIGREIADEQMVAVPSTQQGHYHLYVQDAAIDWLLYERLLEFLAELGALERGYVRASIARQATFVRRPGHKKEPMAA